MQTELPFCTQCGSPVEGNASYCTNCGQRQPQSQRRPQNVTSEISDRTASMLCYIPVFGVIPAIVILASQRFRYNVGVRFNAFQSLYLFVAWLIVGSALPVLIVGLPGHGLEHAMASALQLVLFVCWVYLLVKAAQVQQVRLPILGDLAARSTLEQL